ncbi:hypothetical protein M409DRAFT_23663 [Zasmidium cellare ATCC 36951]|uniref:Uncharacterized protein n=1 Tax=Zasmidium cellare ATCC 36951 TaxID=1080233 RepID=A0A6A6CJ06_ZASCE|nr:uncharacterized protein M409DRAFT_23663 [Zasmidium cellare ATCC 36951]KAF2165932.1 hypothetical protein M409DRAFT_23663 [Zasmidium cellare ATCC 36951]
MNTISLVLNGRTAADIRLLPEKQRASITTLPPSRRPFFAHARTMSSSSTISTITSPSLSSGTSTPRRPGSSSSRTSTPGSGWYNTENNPTLDDYARQLSTVSKKIEIWQGKCAQNVVMALMRPTPIVLFALNPICLILYVLVGVWWMARGGGKESGEVVP